MGNNDNRRKLCALGGGKGFIYFISYIYICVYIFFLHVTIHCSKSSKLAQLNVSRLPPDNLWDPPSGQSSSKISIVHT